MLTPLYSQYVKRYIIGEDLTERTSNMLVIDTLGMSNGDLEALPILYQFLEERDLPERQTNKDPAFKEKWWLWGRPRPIIRKLAASMPRYIATCRTAVNRTFQFEDADVIPDANVIFIGLHDSWFLGVLSSRAHVHWATRIGGWLGGGNDSNYNHSDCFAKFPFPDTSDETLKDRIRDAAERLDALRKEVLARHEDLTLTKLYNVLEALRAVDKAGTVLSDKDRDVATRGCVSLIRQYHDTIDAAVAEAYGWPADLTDEQILEKLVALNKERAAEEARGEIRWLRPEFQKPGFAAPKEQKTLALPETAQPTADVLA